MRSSESLAKLEEADEQTIWTDTEPSRCGNLWAPELHRLEGPNGPRWYVYDTGSRRRAVQNSACTCSSVQRNDPLGPYAYKSRLLDPHHDVWAIDPTVFETASGARYVVWSGTPEDDLPNEKPQHLYTTKLTDPGCW